MRIGVLGGGAWGTALAAMAARKQGITDPDYVHPAMLKDNSK